MLDKYISSLDLPDLKIVDVNNHEGMIEQIEISRMNSVIKVSYYSDTPIKLIFSSTGFLTVSKMFHSASHEEYFDFSLQLLNEHLISKALSELSTDHVFCTGIPNADCLNLETTKNLLRINFPFERFQAVDCYSWFVPPANVPKDELKRKIYQCGKCRSLNWYLKNRRKKNENLTPVRKLKRTLTNSRCKISVLTPQSRRKRIKENRQCRSRLRKKLQDLEKKLVESGLPLNDTQHREMLEAVAAMKERGQTDIENLFVEASSKNKMLGIALRKAWKMDTQHTEQNGFMKDQEKCKKGSKGNRWSPLTYRIALSIFCRSPAAYEALASFEIFKLPSVHTLRAKARKIPSDQGIDLKFLQSEADRFEAHCEKYPEHAKPPKEGILIFDEVKVIGKLIWNSQNDQYVGAQLDSKELASLEDLYKEPNVTEVLEAEYVLQFLWRAAFTKFDIIGPYFMFAKPVSHSVNSNTVMRCMWALNTVGLETVVLVCDGGSSNLTSLRQSLGVASGHIPLPESGNAKYDFRIIPKFKNPFIIDRYVHWIICPSHQLKNNINALHHSQEEGTRDFTVKGVRFGWRQIKDMKKREDDRRECDELAQVKGLRQSHIERDSWTKLNVTPARIMQQNPVLAELYGYANPMNGKIPSDKDTVMACYDYLNACNMIFENGLLSQTRTDSLESDPVKSMLAGLKYFEQWASERLDDGEKLTANKKFLAWQTFELLRIAVYGFVEFIKDMCSRNPGSYVYPIRINGSAVETIFSQMKYIAAGKLTSVNMKNVRRSLIVKKCTNTAQNAEAMYRKVDLDIIDEIC